MKTYNIVVDEKNQIFINGTQQIITERLDNDPITNIDKHILCSLADTMGYETKYLFEEIIDDFNKMEER